MDSKRREFLRNMGLSGTVLVAGCLGQSQQGSVGDINNSSAGNGNSGAETESQVPRPDSTLSADEIDARFEEVSQVVDYETLPLTLSAQPQVVDRVGLSKPSMHPVFGTVSAGIGITETATQESPAKIEISVVNRNDFEYVYKISEAPPYDTKPILYNENGDLLYLVPTPSHPLVNYEDEPYTYAQEGTWRVSEVRDWLPEAFRLESGRGFVGEYAVVGHHESSGRPTGTYSTQGDGETLSLALWETHSPGPDQESVFENVDVPDLPQTPNRDQDDEDNEKTETETETETLWFHEADSETQTYLRPSMEKTDLPADIEFEFINRGLKELTDDGTALYKLVDGKWFRIWETYRDRLSESLRAEPDILPPGGTKRYSLHLFHGKETGCECQSSDAEVITADYLSGGRYAYAVEFGGERHAALLDIEAPELTIEKPDDVEVERKDDTVVVNTIDSEDVPVSRVRVERSEETAGNRRRRVIDEQIYNGNHRYLRYSVPFFEDGVEGVVIEVNALNLELVRLQGGDTGWSSNGTKYRGKTYTAEFLGEDN
ncbi:hypothetical protein ACEU6E_04855 [Halorutilales archaeon Cl-col2-1]